MNTYQIQIRGKSFNLTMSKEKYRKIAGLLNKCAAPNKHSLHDRGSYMMEEWTPSPQWSLSDNQVDSILSFFAGLPADIKSKEYESVKSKLIAFFDTFKESQLDAGRKQSVSISS